MRSDELEALVPEREAELAEAQRELDVALAPYRNPYPTVDEFDRAQRAHVRLRALAQLPQFKKCGLVFSAG
jgi:hypothetical protein